MPYEQKHLLLHNFILSHLSYLNSPLHLNFGADNTGVRPPAGASWGLPVITSFKVILFMPFIGWI